MFRIFTKIFDPRWKAFQKRVKALEKADGPYVEKNTEEGYTIFIINRGEQLFYKDRNGAVIVEISLSGQWMDADSIKAWDGCFKMTKKQKSLAINRICRFFAKYCGFTVEVMSGGTDR